MEIVNLILELTISLQYNREGNDKLSANSLCVLVLAILLNDGRGITMFFLFGLQKEVFAYYRRYVHDTAQLSSRHDDCTLTASPQLLYRVATSL